jgi:ABC-type polysaccharide/polyol phosphate transport system ATPase subunit
VNAPAVVQVRGLAKRFRDENMRPPRSLRQRLGALGGHRPKGSMTVLEDVCFSIGRGESVAVLGRNGSGKSTLLRLVAGVYEPSDGMITVNGRIAAVLSLGLGFHPELTGADNMSTYAAIIGLARQRFSERFAAMVEFSGVGDAIYRPVKHYSTGMQSRIALSVALFADPDLLIVDEVLSVGDREFRERVRHRLRAYRLCGGSSLVVSHDTKLLRDQCDRGLWLEGGRLVMDEAIDRVVDAYETGR